MATENKKESKNNENVIANEIVENTVEEKIMNTLFEKQTFQKASSGRRLPRSGWRRVRQ